MSSFFSLFSSSSPEVSNRQGSFIVDGLSQSLYRDACGRGEPLGALYNIHTDRFVHGSIFNAPLDQSFITVVKSDSLNYSSSLLENVKDRCSAVNLSGELSVSVLAGLVPVEGSVKFIHDSKSHEHAVQCSVNQHIRTVTQSLNFYNKKMLEHIALGALSSGATHVVWQVKKGMDACMSVIYKYRKGSTLTDAQGALKMKMEKWKLALEGSGLGSYAGNETFSCRDLDIMVYADVVPPQCAPPTTLDQAMDMLKKIHETVTVDSSEGVVKEYGLLDLRQLARVLEVEFRAAYMYRELSNRTVRKLEEMWKEIEEQKLRICVLKNKAENPVTSHESRQRILDKFRACEDEEGEIKRQLMVLLPKVRAGDDDAVYHLADLRCEELSKDSVDNFMKKCKAVIRGINLNYDLSERNVQFIEDQETLNRLKRDNKSKEDNNIYILFFSIAIEPEEEEVWSKTLEMFLAIEDNENNILLAVNKDNNIDILTSEKIMHDNKIALWSCGSYQTKDLLDLARKSNTNLAYPLTPAVEKRKKYEDIVYAKFRCPKEACNLDQRSPTLIWYCNECKEMLDYDLEGYFYCECGSRPVKQFKFKCCSQTHGSSKDPFVDEIAADLGHLKKYKQINILIIGETGVGKTTFINSTACYTRHSTLAEAEQNDFMWLIPFVIQESGNPPIEVGNCDNERLNAVDQSCTKDPRCHYFKVEGYLYCLIDTPGIGDTEGIQQDKKNMQKIMDFLKRFDQLHQICFLVKTNEARLTETFEFCFKELVMQFHKSALDNFVFCFTQGCGSCYRPGGTWQPLNTLMDEINTKLNVNYKLEQDKTVFVVDNFSYRYLALTLIGGIKVPERDVYDHGYKVSSKVIRQMMNLATSSKPHRVQDSLNVNKARNVILALNEPLTKIAEAVRKTVGELVERLEMLDQAVKKQESLKSQVDVTITKYEFRMVKENRHMCKECCTVVLYRGDERNPFIEADPSIAFLDPFKMYQGPSCEEKDGIPLCKIHGKNFTAIQMGKTFYPEEKKVIRRDPEVAEQLKTAKSETERNKILLLESMTVRNQLEIEEEAINEASAKFGLFLKNNTLVPFNDKTENYLVKCMEVEENKNGCGTQRFKGLSNMLEQYEKARKVIIERLDKGDALALKSITPDEILNLIDQLQTLPHYGHDISAALHFSQEEDREMETVPTYFKDKSNPHLKNCMKFLEKRLRNLTVVFQDPRFIQIEHNQRLSKNE